MDELIKFSESELENFIKSDNRSDKDKFAWLDQNKNVQDEEGFLRVANAFLATMEHRYQRLKFMLFDNSPLVEEQVPSHHGYSRMNNPHALLVSPFRVELPSGCSVIIDTGKKLSIKSGYFARIAPISELGYGFSIVPFEAVYYRPLKETVKVKLFNHGDTDYEIREGDPIAMLIEYPFENFEESFNPWG
jgi:dUTPase